MSLGQEEEEKAAWMMRRVGWPETHGRRGQNPSRPRPTPGQDGWLGGAVAVGAARAAASACVRLSSQKHSSPVGSLFSVAGWMLVVLGDA